MTTPSQDLPLRLRPFSSLLTSVLTLSLIGAVVPDDGGSAPPRQVEHALHAVRGDDPAIVDDLGRQVLLRGVNVVQLGDYYQADPASPPTFPLTRRDMEAIAAFGFNHIRLIIHWSAIEPEPGRIDEAYLDRIEEAIGWARENDLYVVLDLHQDAWSKHIATPDGETCIPPFEPAVGWDGAPAWATITDGLPTCRLELREFAPAVVQAFTNFYADRPAADGVGIQSHLVDVWAAVAGRFADDPTVAGYDLLNEPHPGWTPGVTPGVLLGRYYDRAVDAIRASETANDGLGHIAFFEPSIVWSAAGTAPPVPPTFTDDTNIVFAPHLYAGSLSVTPGLSVEDGFDLAAQQAALYGTTFWSGEYGWFGNPSQQADLVDRYGEMEDAHLVGSAWWSWRQACGDPHNHQDPANPARVSPSLIRYRCPGNIELGTPPAFHRVLSRAYPRAAPGRLVSVDSDEATGALEVVGEAGVASGQRIDLWIPERIGRPVVTGDGVRHVRIFEVDGGFRVTAEVHDRYTVDVRPPGPRR